MSTGFQGLGISQELHQLLKQNGIQEPTPVQRQTIPLLLKGQDVIAQAQTGTGKTLAFALPILERIDTSKEQVQALILTPTRELAIQITTELKKLAPVVGANILAAYGGQDVDAQIKKLKHAPHIVVATPGRLIDHMKRETISLGKLSFLVLDEADQMLHMGFLPEVVSIITSTPSRRQTLLFSATIPDAIRRLASDYMQSPTDIQVKSTNVTLDSIQQIVIETTDRAKQQTLVHLLQEHQPYLGVVFCRTKVRAKKLNEALQELGIASDELHGDLTQSKREQVMKRFRDARLQILVATDVAARGLDVEGVTHVYNYDAPTDAELYIHRIGRTGRAGHQGMAITLATPYDKSKIEDVERGINARLQRFIMNLEGQLTSTRESGIRPKSTRTRSDSKRRNDERQSGRPAGRRSGEGGRSQSRNEKQHSAGTGRQASSGRRPNRTAGAKSTGAPTSPWEAASEAQENRDAQNRNSGSSRSRGNSRSQGSNRSTSNTRGAASTNGSSPSRRGNRSNSSKRVR